MPANKKYLSSPGQRFLKITAGFLGGYVLMLSFHLFISIFIPRNYVLQTANFSSYLIWCILLLIAFLSKNGWKIWGMYMLLSILLYFNYLMFAS